jgi:glycerol-3-phosphate O-acyltransferase
MLPQNLDMPIVGNILRGGGAFFIRRNFAGDHLYPVVIREYIEELLQGGRNIECFIEGTRSRTGKLLPPKLGILKYIVEALQTGRTTDCWICPVSLQYDSVIESETYVTELLGKPKEQESLLGLLSGSGSLLSLKLGRIDVRFQKPWSLKEFIDEQTDRRKMQFDSAGGQTQKVDFAENNEHKTLLLKALGYRVMGDINRTSVVMPAALVGTVLLTLRGRVSKTCLRK